jgi:hypothetical protein
VIGLTFTAQTLLHKGKYIEWINKWGFSWAHSRFKFLKETSWKYPKLFNNEFFHNILEKQNFIAVEIHWIFISGKSYLWYQPILYLFIYLYYCYAGGTLWHLQKYLYQIHRSWIHPLHHSPLSLLPHYWNSFNRSYFSIYIHVYIVFAQYSPSYIPTSFSFSLSFWYGYKLRHFYPHFVVVSNNCRQIT